MYTFASTNINCTFQTWYMIMGLANTGLMMQKRLQYNKFYSFYKFRYFNSSGNKDWGMPRGNSIEPIGTGSSPKILN